jgi:SAM-dependent methyltransferase
MFESVPFWEAILCSPVDHQSLQKTGDHRWQTSGGDFVSDVATVGTHQIPDFRAIAYPQTIQQAFTLPVEPLNRQDVAQNYFRAVNQSFAHYNQQEIRTRFGTKLDKGMQYYCQQLWQEKGASARILDLGCGSGGNRVYLQSLGFKHIVGVDWVAKGADLLVDAHRLPFTDSVFDLVISTAVFEHLYNPFIAMSEISRVCCSGGLFVGSASFWEAWHGSSYFHISPDGWHALFTHAGMDIVDLWAGWGVMPALFSHVLTPGYLRSFGYTVQSIIESLYRIALREAGLRRLQLRASGSYQVCARKK